MTVTSMDEDELIERVEMRLRDATEPLLQQLRERISSLDGAIERLGNVIDRLERGAGDGWVGELAKEASLAVLELQRIRQEAKNIRPGMARVVGKKKARK